MLCTFIFYADITIFYADLKNMLLCISAFFSVSTLCMQFTILATAVVFIIEHPFMDDDSLPKWLMGKITQKACDEVDSLLCTAVGKIWHPRHQEILELVDKG